MTTDLQSQFQEYITSQIESITIDNINQENLGDDLLESELDMILCIKKQYQEELTIEEKKGKVKDILEDILTTSNRTDLDNKILDLAKQSRLHAEKAQKKKDLLIEFNQCVEGKVHKQDIEKARKDLREDLKATTKNDKELQKKIKAARKARRDISKEKSKKRTLDKTAKAIQQAKAKAEKGKYLEELLQTLNEYFKAEIPKKDEDRTNTIKLEPKQDVEYGDAA